MFWTNVRLANILKSKSRFCFGVGEVHLQICKSSSHSFNGKRLVYFSKSQNIFSNLALEEWLYENEDLSCSDILLIWQNSPTVVIGRHQNPWLEANIPLMVENNVMLSRR